MLRRDLRRQLAFKTAVFVVRKIRKVREYRLSPDIRLLISAGCEEPQPIPDHAAAKRSLVLVIEVVEVCDLGGEVGFLRPARIAAGLRDRADDAACEPPELRRNAAGQHGRLLNRVFDVQRIRLAAQVLVHHHAVDQEDAVERMRTRDRDLAVRAGVSDAGRQ